MHGTWNGGSWLGCVDLPGIGRGMLSGGWLNPVEEPGYLRDIFHLRCPYDQILDIHFLTFLYAIGLF